MIFSLLGGIGMFLLGMVLMTDGLKAAAGDSLRRILQRATRSQTSAVLHGAVLTAMVQSSSATTMATIGFVSAGVLTFHQAIGVIFGATVGTTSTGWIVSMLGLKLSIGTFALPIVGLGALTRLLARGPMQSVGLAIGGFGLIFVGIDVLQQAMITLSEQFDPRELPTGSVFGSLVLVVIGVVMTIIMQSSSAAVATTMAALNGGAVTFEQAAPLVIGQSIGTTVTSALASMGASVAAKRTALAHVLFSVGAGVLAFALLPLLHWILDTNAHAATASHNPVSLAAFHTSFTVLGVMVFMPFTAQFAGVITRLIPEPEYRLTRNLDRSILGISSVAVEAARRTVIDIAAAVFESLRLLVDGQNRGREVAASLREAAQALAETRQFLAAVRTEPGTPAIYQRHVAALHAVDHLSRMVEACEEIEPAKLTAERPELRAQAMMLCHDMNKAMQRPRGADDGTPVELMRLRSVTIADQRRVMRPRLLEQTATGEIDPDLAMRLLEAWRWIDRLAYHAWRAVNYLQETPEADPADAHGSAVKETPDGKHAE